MNAQLGKGLFVSSHPDDVSRLWLKFQTNAPILCDSCCAVVALPRTAGECEASHRILGSIIAADPTQEDIHPGDRK